MSLTTDHTEDITRLRDTATRQHSATQTSASVAPIFALVADAHALAADLLEMHDQTGISLDEWLNGRQFVERLIGHSIEENGV